MIYHTRGSRPAATRRLWFAAGLAALALLVGVTTFACGGTPDRPGGAAGPPGAATAGPGGTGGIGGAGTPDPAGPPPGGPGGPDQPPPDGPEAPDGPGEEPASPAAEDCVGYDPANLTVEQYGDAWRLRDGAHGMLLFDTQADAQDGLAVARNWTRMCFVGRGTDRADRHRYIVNYWQEPSGLPLGPAPDFDCIPYDPADLALYGPDPEGWHLFSGAVPLLVLDTEADARRMELVAAVHTQLCLIGHGNDRPDPYRYRTEYWRQ